LEAYPYMSKRFLMKRFLGLTDEEILENETMWQEERDNPAARPATGSDLRGVGITPSDMESDVQAGEDFGADLGDLGGDEFGGAPPAGPEIGGAPPPPPIPTV
jgi:hypothetical protein